MRHLMFIWMTLSVVFASNKPSPRWALGCAMLSGALYCYGGQLRNETSNEMYKLDLYKSWNTDEPSWSQDTAGSAGGPATAYYALAVFSNRLFINGGSQPLSYPTLIYDKSQWLTLPTSRNVQRKQHTATADHEGRLWLWGGISDYTTYGGPTIYHNSWIVIDTNTWSYSYPIVHYTPPPRIDHTATAMPNGQILIMGGVVYSRNITDPSGAQTLNPVSMSSLMLFDTAGGQWSNVTAGGNIPAPRRGHSACLSWDESSILMFGGGTPDENTLLNDLFILELDSMRWTAPSIHGVPPKPRKYHNANVVDDLMLVMFGMGNGPFNDIGILSTSTWSWTTQYISNPAWLSGNLSASHGVVENSTGTYSTDTRSSSRDPDDAPYVQEQNITVPIDTNSDPQITTGKHIRITAGVIAGVLSGGVVVIGGGVFLIVTVIIYRRRNKADAVERRSTLNSTLSSLILPRQKPDNRSSDLYAVQIDNETHKPDAL